MKIRPLEADLLHADVLTDTMMLIVAVRSFAKARKWTEIRIVVAYVVKR